MRNPSRQATTSTHDAITWVDRLATRRTWIVATAVFLPFAVTFFASAAPFAIPEVRAACGTNPPDLRFFSTANDVHGFLEACGPAGRSAYRNMQFADLAYPAVVGLFLASSLALALRRLTDRGPLTQLIVAAPLAATAFDYIENLFAWRALAAFPGTAPMTGAIGFASAAKTITSWVSGLALLSALALLATRFLRQRRSTVLPHPSPADTTERATASA